MPFEERYRNALSYNVCYIKKHILDVIIKTLRISPFFATEICKVKYEKNCEIFAESE